MRKIIVVLAILLGFACARGVAARDAASDTAALHRNTWEAPDDSDIHRYAHQKVLHCGYDLNPPFVYQEAATGRLTGIFYDLVMEIARRNEWRVEWRNHSLRYEKDGEPSPGADDAYCAGTVPLYTEEFHPLYSRPVLLGTYGVFVKTEDHRFDADWRTLNNHGARVAYQPPLLATRLRQADFPAAQTVQLPGLTPAGLFIVDALIADPVWVQAQGASAQLLRNIAPAGALGQAPYSILFDSRQKDLAIVFNRTLRALEAENFPGSLLARYNGAALGLTLPAR